MRRTKIVDTIGPATQSLDQITRLIEAGMNVARLNRSHGTSQEHLQVYRNIRRASASLQQNVGIMVDLQGPKIRCGWVGTPEANESVPLQEGQDFAITTEELIGDNTKVSTTFAGLPQDCHVGDIILIDDGKIRLEVKSCTATTVHTTVLVGGELSSHKGINLPGVPVSLPALTEKDEADLRWALQTGADMVAMSFVRSAQDIVRAHQIMDEEQRRIPIIAKIEKPQAVDNLEAIVQTFDGIMVARGDLAVEIPLYRVPIVTKHCINLARYYAKPVIVATEVLGSMVSSPTPTRAEASDCANAVLDGVDATMTSNETAVGQYPYEAVATMANISEYATEEGSDRIYRLPHYDMSDGGAVAQAALDLARTLNARAIVAFTRRGNTAFRVSRVRPNIPLYAMTMSEATQRWLALSWGTETFLLDYDYHELNRERLMELTSTTLLTAGKVQHGDYIVVVSCAKGSEDTVTDSIYIHKIQ